MSQKCRMRSCEFEASDTEQIWTVDPSNTSEKPVCRYHSFIHSMMESGVAPAIMFSSSVALTYLLVGTSSMIPFMLSFLISILVVSLTFFTALMSLEMIVRYFFMDLDTLRISEKTKKEHGECSSHNCSKCGDDKTFEAVWKKYEKKLELLGTPIKTYSEGVNVYCESCYEELTNNETDGTEHDLSDKEKCLN